MNGTWSLSDCLVVGFRNDSSELYVREVTEVPRPCRQPHPAEPFHQIEELTEIIVFNGEAAVESARHAGVNLVERGKVFPELRWCEEGVAVRKDRGGNCRELAVHKKQTRQLDNCTRRGV